MSPGRTATPLARWLDANPSLPYVLPFAAFMLLLAGQSYLAALGRWDFPLRVAFLAAVIWIGSRQVLNFRVSRGAASTGIGIAVFLIWIGPDVLISGYRDHWLFQNAVMGKLSSSIAPALLADPLVLTFRAIRAVLLVPILEELFWRGWLMRWLISTDFRKVPLGAYAPGAFWITALLFASEHGPFWDVGLVTGVIYNWWIVRTRSLGDCILMHAVTNACLSLYVIVGRHWEYWL
jgi:CAAX prenyl protease-like protein